MRKLWIATVIIAVVVGLSPGASASDLPMVTGKEWNGATEKERRSFLIGMGTVIALEYQLQAKRRNAGEETLIPTFVQGLKETNFGEMMAFIDDYYRRNPDRIKRPVVDVLFSELAVPRSQVAGKRQRLGGKP